MEAFRTFSHFNGAECLAIRKPSLHREIFELLKECHRSVPTDDDARSNVRFLQGFSERFARLAQQLAWRKTSTGLEKEQVAMNLHIPSALERFSLEQILSNRLWSYSVGNIDVGVEILPEKIAKPRLQTRTGKEHSSDNFEKAVAEIKRLGRPGPLVPLLLIGVTL